MVALDATLVATDLSSSVVITFLAFVCEPTAGSIGYHVAISFNNGAPRTLRDRLRSMFLRVINVVAGRE